MINTTIIGGYRQSGIIAKGNNTGISGSRNIIDFTGCQPSGVIHGNALAVCLYVYSGSGYPSNAGRWIPLKREYL